MSSRASSRRPNAGITSSSRCWLASPTSISLLVLSPGLPITREYASADRGFGSDCTSSGRRRWVSISPEPSSRLGRSGGQMRAKFMR